MSIRFDADSRGRLLMKASPAFRTEARMLPHCIWLKEERCWRLLPRQVVREALQPYMSISVCSDAAKAVFAKMESEARELRKQYMGLMAKVAKADELKSDMTELGRRLPPLKSEMMGHQMQGFAIGTELDNFALLMEQGCGKTLTVIAVMGYRFLKGQVTRVVVVCPKAVVPVWRREMARHADYPYELNIITSKRARKGAIITSPRRRRRLSILVVSYELAWRLIERLEAWQPDMVIADESQKMKSTTAKRSRGLRERLAPIVPYRMIMTGTPVAQAPEDIWCQYKFLEPMLLGTLTDFREKYVKSTIKKNRKTGSEFRKVLGYKKLEELADRVHSIAYRVTKKEALDLPEEVDQELYATLEPKAQGVYEDLEDKLRATLGGGEVSAPIILTQMLRLQQVCGGFVPVKPDEDSVAVTVETGTEKLDALSEFLDGYPQDEKLVIFARFVPEVEAIAERVKAAGRTVDMFYGKTTEKRREQLLTDFMQSTDPSTLVLQISTGGVGIDLQVAPTAVFYSTTFSFLDYEQARARVHRIGQTADKVSYVHLIAEGTIDEEIMVALAEKRSFGAFINDICRKYSPSGDVMYRGDDEDDIDLEEALAKIENQIADSNLQLHDDEVTRMAPKTTKKRAAKKKAASKSGAARASTEGMVTIADIAEEVGKSPADMRKLLRNSDIEKPGASWAWKPNHRDIKRVKALAGGGNPPRVAKKKATKKKAKRKA